MGALLTAVPIPAYDGRPAFGDTPRESPCVSLSSAAGPAACTPRPSPSSWTPGTTSPVWERNAADDTFGFGVVFSDETLGGIEHADVEIFSAMRHEFAHWDAIDIHYRGQCLRSGGHGFSGIERKELLAILRPAALRSGCEILFDTEVDDHDES